MTNRKHDSAIARTYGFLFAAIADHYSNQAKPDETMGDSIVFAWPIFSFFGTLVVIVVDNLLILSGVVPEDILHRVDSLNRFVRYGWSLPIIALINFRILISSGLAQRSLYRLYRGPRYYRKVTLIWLVRFGCLALLVGSGLLVYWTGI